METKTGPPELAQVYRDHRVRLLRLAYLLTGSYEQSEDLVHTAFASALTYWASIDNHLAYLRRAIVNRAADQRRSLARRPRFRMQEPVSHPPEIDETWAEVQKLPPVQRAVVILRFYEDLPLVEIAMVMNRPAATVRSDLKRALDRLRKAFRS